MRARGARRAGALAVPVLLAAGCAHVPPGTDDRDGLTLDQRQARLESVDSWEMSGRLAVDTGERAFPARFRWLQDDDISPLSVRGPLGAGSLEVTGSPERMMITAGGEQRVLEDPEADLSAQLGWWLPVESLGDWLLGMPDPEFEAETRIERDTVLRTLEQRLWRLEFVSYQLSGGLLVPRRIDMAHGPLEVRLTVDTWSAADAATRLELGSVTTAK
jgi:outer membrane lipoprotein LolB